MFSDLKRTFPAQTVLRCYKINGQLIGQLITTGAANYNRGSCACAEKQDLDQLRRSSFGLLQTLLPEVPCAPSSSSIAAYQESRKCNSLPPRDASKQALHGAEDANPCPSLCISSAYLPLLHGRLPTLQPPAGAGHKRQALPKRDGDSRWE